MVLRAKTGMTEQGANKLGWMVGSPPPPDRIVRFDDGSYWRSPALRWTVSNFRQLMPTVNVSRGLGPTVALPYALRDDIDGLTFTPLGSQGTMTWRASLDANYTDGIVVLHKGRIVLISDTLVHEWPEEEDLADIAPHHQVAMVLQHVEGVHVEPVVDEDTGIGPVSERPVVAVQAAVHDRDVRVVDHLLERAARQFVDV